MCALDSLAHALLLLTRLNRATDASGVPLPSRLRVDGFEPWWFGQEQLFWQQLVPYAQWQATASRAEGPTGAARTPGENDVASRLSGAGAACQPPDGGGGASHLRAALRQLGLAATSLWSLLLWRLSGRDTLLYTIDKVTPGADHDVRISGIYRELRLRGYRFGEYVHVNDAAEAWPNALKRRRPVVFFESLTNLGALLLASAEVCPSPAPAPALDGAGPGDAFVREVAAGALSRAALSARRLRILKWLLRVQGARRAVILDDSRHANELIAACKALGIPTLGYMHGLLNRYHPGLMAYGFGRARRHTFDLYGLWSEYFRRRVLAGDLYAEEGTFVCGPLRPPSPEQFVSLSETSRRDVPPLRVLLITEPRAPLAEIRRYLAELVGDSRFRVALKIRPGDRIAYVDESVGALPETIDGGSVHDAVLNSDVVLGTYSTALYEAALALRPVVVLNTSFTYGHDLVYDGLAELAESPETVCNTVLKAARLPQLELAARRTCVWGEDFGDGACKLLDRAEAQLWERPLPRKSQPRQAPTGQR